LTKFIDVKSISDYACRIPGEEVDELRHFDSAESKHIVVNYRGMYYTVECYDERNKILSPTSLQAQFEWIIKDAEEHIESGKYLQSITGRKNPTYLPIPVLCFRCIFTN